MEILLDKLKTNPSNPRRLMKEQFERLKDSIESFTKMLEIRPIAYDEDGVIWGGNMRYLALRELGIEMKPEYFKELKGFTLEERREFAIRDNIELGEWDDDILANEWSDLPLDDWGIDTVGWDNKEVVEDDAPEVSDEEPESKLGEVYLLGRHRLMCGDSTKIEDVEKLMNGQKADMVFTDPPYGIDYSDTKRKFEKIIGDDKNPEQLVYEALSLHSGIPAYVCCNWQSMGNVGLAMEEAGFNIKSCIVWDKGVRIQNLDKFYKRHEFILYSGRFGGEKTIDGDVWQISRETRDDHPTAKPVELCARAIRYEEGNSILDLFGGSGSTLIACEQLNRTCYMMEISEAYCDVIRKRYAKFIGKEEEWQTITLLQNK